jgi:hypothetical protein
MAMLAGTPRFMITPLRKNRALRPECPTPAPREPEIFHHGQLHLRHRRR